MAAADRVDSEVVVIGGGLMSLGIVWEIQQAGHRVMLLAPPPQGSDTVDPGATTPTPRHCRRLRGTPARLGAQVAGAERQGHSPTVLTASARVLRPSVPACMHSPVTGLIVAAGFGRHELQLTPIMALICRQL